MDSKRTLSALTGGYDVSDITMVSAAFTTLGTGTGCGR